MKRYQLKEAFNCRTVYEIFSEEHLNRQSKAHCPSEDHVDDTESFHVYADGYKCYGCGISGDVLDLVMLLCGCDERYAYKLLIQNDEEGTALELAPTPPRASRREIKDLWPELSRLDYVDLATPADVFGFPIAAQLEVFERQVPVYVGPNDTVAFAHEVPGGVVHAVKFRPKYGTKWSLTGSQPKHSLFYPSFGKQPSDTLLLCEGERDTILCDQLTYFTEVLGLPSGVGLWNTEWHNTLRRFSKIVIGFDNDIAGRGAAAKLESLLYSCLPESEITTIFPPSEKDDWVLFAERSGCSHVKSVLRSACGE